MIPKNGPLSPETVAARVMAIAATKTEMIFHSMCRYRVLFVIDELYHGSLVGGSFDAAESGGGMKGGKRRMGRKKIGSIHVGKF
jgi:hypothetical protein